MSHELWMLWTYVGTDSLCTLYLYIYSLGIVEQNNLCHQASYTKAHKQLHRLQVINIVL